MKIFESELRILDTLWQEGDTTAKRLAEILKEQVQWSKTTTYTVIKKCIDKGVVSREEPNFVCHAVITREQAQKMETNELINKMYGGMPDQLVASILWNKDLSAEEIERLKKLIDELN
ncbi:MAG: BlaI/MecI/CopY family transcriptional regulator [Clostridiales bacterium]|nr:BlaI/MecI/CopY family transcriptional regulator [Clostridiales bacterium]